jgi:alginate O-acetyltransferase complex protein AlgI
VLFHTTEFFIFFAIVWSLYVVLRVPRLQNPLLLVASYVFYGWWNWKLLGLILLSTTMDYTIARVMGATEDPRKRRGILLVSLVLNLGLLGFFKYFNFFIDSASMLLQALGLGGSHFTLSIILPVGISFYTFQSLSYTIDVYRKELEPTRDFVLFALYVNYFPQLVAGPIERATHLLPMLARPRAVTWDGMSQGAWLIFFGLFKKIVVADNMATIADPIFDGRTPVTGLHALLGVYAFAFQIYGDFSGYTDIARGVSKWFGIDLMLNFRRPYFSTDPREFWTRWHISLSQWLRDYLYISLGGNRGGEVKTYRNLFLTMLLGGLWHGATWMYVAWGAFHGLALIVHRLWTSISPFEKNPRAARFFWPVFVFVMFHVACVGWIFFRAHTLASAIHVFRSLAGSYSLGAPEKLLLYRMVICCGPLLLVDAWMEIHERIAQVKHDTHYLQRTPAVVRGVVYATLGLILAAIGAPSGKEFIYFQF